MSRAALAVIVALQILLGTGGCAPPRQDLPTYPWTDDQTALHLMAKRAHLVRTVSAEAMLTLTRRDGQSVRLDGVMAMSLPQSSVRLQAWKFNQKALDLSVTPAGLWIETPREKGDEHGAVPANLGAAQLARGLSLFSGDLFQDREAHVIDRGGRYFGFRQQMENGQILTAEIDRPTLTVRRYVVADPSGRVRFALDLQGYRSIGPMVWPLRMIAQSEYGQIRADLRDVQINPELEAGAFVPPRGAKKVQ